MIEPMPLNEKSCLVRFNGILLQGDEHAWVRITSNGVTDLICFRCHTRLRNRKLPFMLRLKALILTHLLRKK